MDIRPFTPGSDSGIIQEPKTQAIPGQQVTGPGEDMTSIGGNTGEGLPNLTAVAPELSAAGTSPEPRAASGTAFSLVAASPSIPMDRQLEAFSEKSVTFFSRRLVRIPGMMDKFRQVAPGEAGEILTSGGEGARQRLYVEVNGGSLVPFSGTGDVNRLAAFEDPSGQSEPVKELARLLKKSESLGCSISSGDKTARGAFAAFHHLTGESSGTSPFTVSYEDMPLVSLAPGSAGDMEHFSKTIDELEKAVDRLGGHSDLVECVMKTFDDVPLNFRIGIAKGLDHRIYDEDGDYYRTDAKKDYQKLLERSKDAQDFMALSRAYIGVRMIMMKTEQDYDLDRAFEFVAGPLRNRPDDARVYLGLLKSGHSTSNAEKIFQVLPQPPQAGDYEKTAAAFRAFPHFETPAIELAMKPVFDVPLKERIALVDGLRKHLDVYTPEKQGAVRQVYDRLAEGAKDGSDFVSREKLLMEILGATKGAVRMEPVGEVLNLISKGLTGASEEHSALLDILKCDIHVDKALPAYHLVITPLDGDSLRDRTAAFTTIFKEIYKGNDNYVRKATCDYGVTTLCREPHETLRASVERLSSVNRVLLTSPCMKKTSWKKTATNARDLLLWTSRERRKGTFGDRSLDEALSLVLEKVMFASSLDEARQSALISLGVKDPDTSILELDNTIIIGGIKLDIKTRDS